MRVGLKPEIMDEVNKRLDAFKELGFIPEMRLDLDNVEITVMGGSKEVLILPKITFTFFVPDNYFEIKRRN